MSKADFLVNVDTVHDTRENIEAIPSKLIDYSFSGRPILNISSAFVDESVVIDFMNRDYSRQRRIDISNYNIQKVCSQFLELIN